MKTQYGFRIHIYGIYIYSIIVYHMSHILTNYSLFNSSSACQVGVRLAFVAANTHITLLAASCRRGLNAYLLIDLLSWLCLCLSVWCALLLCR